mgnify:CR=1 FL=1
MKNQPIVVLITAPSPETGEQIANVLLDQKLAACVNIVPQVKSLYTWQGQTCTDTEALLIVKTHAGLLKERLIPAVQAIHPYEVPEIIALPILGGLKSYLDWVDQSTE